MDEKRILSIQTLMKQTTEVQRQVLPFITKCLDEMDRAADSIDPKAVSNKYIYSLYLLLSELKVKQQSHEYVMKKYLLIL